VADVERLRDELALAEAMEPLEKAREKMHADRSPANVKAYKKAAAKATEARQGFRRKYPSQQTSGDGDAVATPDTVKVTTKVQEGR
jgi:F0F1-type ATP synthase membrane subunit b/b'